jgi:small membrane protein
MRTIQVLLIALILLAAIVGSVAFRSRLAYRLLGMFFFLVATLCVLFPDSTTDIAKSLGVGRGTDLLLYLVIFAGVHACLLLYMRTRRLERKLTQVVRAIAIRDAERLSENEIAAVLQKSKHAGR